jgi:hypothetical protein
MNPDLTYGANQYNYLKLHYKYKLDFRDYAPYPLNGYYFDVQFNKIGFGLFNTMNFTSIEFNFDQYFTLYKRFYFAYRLAALITNKNKFQPYLVRPGIEIDDFDMRGYELYVINGQELGMFKSNFKFEIIPMKTLMMVKDKETGEISEVETVVDRDNCNRPQTTLEGLASLNLSLNHLRMTSLSP